MFRRTQLSLMAGALLLSLVLGLVLARYIHAQRRAEEEANLHRERLAHVTRLSTMGEMAAGIAHEINQPLTAIAAYAQGCRRLMESGQFDSGASEALDMISSQAQRTSEIIRRLRNFVDKRESSRQAVSINEITREVVKLAEPDARIRDSRIRLNLAGSLESVVVDPIQIQQVLLNLIRNGLEAMLGQGTAAEGVLVRTRSDGGDAIEIAVEDRGTGVAEEVENDLFDPFFTTKKSGMGMGLSVSSSIIASHGGRLWFERNPAGGSTFKFTLPTAIGVNHV